MNDDFIARRIGQLRVQKGISARDMSLSLGQSESYINKIENRKALPSIGTLLYICDFFGITPMEFFEEENIAPEKIQAIVRDLKTLNQEQLDVVASLIRQMKKTF